MRFEITKGSEHYFEVPNKLVTFRTLFEKFFPTSTFFNLNTNQTNVPFPRFFTYSRVHISSDTAFLKIVKKPSIVQE